MTIRWCFAICLAFCVVDSVSAQGVIQGRSGLTVQFASGGLIDLASREAVLKELGIAKDAPEVAELRRLWDAVRQEARNHIDNPNDEDKADRGGIGQRAQDKFLPDLKKLLTPEQFARLQQIHWQQMGQNAYMHPDVMKVLDITKEDQAKLIAAQAEFRDSYQKLFRRPGVPADDDIQVFQKKLKDVQAAWEKKVNEIVSKEKQEKFAALQGKPFNIAANTSGRRGMPISLRPGGLMALALKEPVLKELGIEKDAPEVAELKKLADAMKKEFDRRFRDPTPEDQDNRQGIGPKVQAQFDPELKKLLKPEQFTRLQQLNWQLQGLRALEDADVIKALDITKEQQEKLSAVELEFFRKRRASSKLPVDPNVDNLALKKMRDQYYAEIQERETKINEILSKAQQDKFAELKGKPFELSLIND